MAIYTDQIEYRINRFRYDPGYKTSYDWPSYAKWQDYSESDRFINADGLYVFQCSTAGDGSLPKIGLEINIGAHKTSPSDSLGQDPFLMLYVLTALPNAPKDVPSRAVATAIIPIVDGVNSYTAIIENMNVSAAVAPYLAITYSGGASLQINVSQIFSVTSQIDDTPPTCYLYRPTPTSIPMNYDNINIWFAVNSTASGIDFSNAELQCSYDNNDWSNPIISQPTHKYNVSACTLHGGTLYCRCRAKTRYSDWADWTCASFVVYENAVSIKSVSPYESRYLDRTQAITLSWDYGGDAYNYGVTLNGAEIEYSTDGGSTYSALDTVQGSIHEYVVAANFFPAIAYSGSSGSYGGIHWRVRGFNANLNPGSWSCGSFATIDRKYSSFNLDPANLTSKDETNKIVFSWLALNNIAYGSEATGADLEYRYPDGTWQPLGDGHIGQSDLHLQNGLCRYEVAANTFDPSIVYWHVRTYNQDNIAGDWSYEASFTTIDAPSIATPISPIGTIEDTDSDLLFRWSSYSSSGTPPTQADIQYSYDGNTWISLEPTDGTPYTTVPGGTIHAGTVQWRVRSYNRNHTPGNWSDPAVFVARAAPKIQEVTADGKPFTTITWQATDQQTYEIEVDGYSYGSIFGVEKSFQLPDYLEDGIHSVRVRVQNEMSMWSQPGELTFSVLNTPGAELLLSGDFDLDADLFWEDNSGHTDYLVYRDGTCIGETSHKHFSDRVVLGEHTYYVVNRFNDGCFSKSNIVEHTLNTDFPQLAFLSGGDWLPLEKSENAQQTQRFTHNRKVAYHHFSGDKNPTPEVGDEEVLTAEFDAAWFYTEEGSKTLKSLLGQALIIKSRGEEVVIGVLEAYTKVNRKHFRGYAFSIRQMEWKDYICAE